MTDVLTPGLPGAPPPSSDRAPRSIHPPGDPQALASPRGFFTTLSRLRREPNAIWMREMRQSARLARTPWFLFALVLPTSLLLTSIGGIAASSSASPAELGGWLFQTFFGVSYFVVVFVGPALAANGIAAEREGRTWEAVLLTGMTPKEIARGKFLAAYTTMALYLVALAPVGALSFLFGGVTASEVVLAFLLLFIIAALTVAFGLAVSSFMSHLRGTIVVTLMLAAALGPMIFSMGGFAGSLAAHRLWPEIPEGMPIWLPLAWERAPFSLLYAVLLLLFPCITIAVPGWFLYEATVANLSGEADDRSSGLKRWFTWSTPALALAASIPSLLATDDGARAGLSVGGILAFTLFVLSCALLFAAEPPGPSRRVETRWQRAGAGAGPRFMGPGLFRTMLLVVFLFLIGVGAIALIDGVMLATHAASSSREESLQQIALVAAYVTPYVIFAVGLVAFLRARNATAWVPRIVAVAILLMIGVAPWVAAAIAGVVADSSARAWILLASPSPFFLIPMLGDIDHVSRDASLTISVGMAFAVGWGFVGLVLLSSAKRRSDRILAERDMILRRAHAAYEAEERAVAAPPAAPADPIPSAVTEA